VKFVLYLTCDNSAFGERDDDADAPDVPECREEVARILHHVADELESGADDYSMFRTLRDYNGNDVGRAAFKRQLKVEAT
jgi:hypothetical protein